MGKWVWVLPSHTRTRSTPWVLNFLIYVPMGIILFHTRTPIGYLPAGYMGHGYPLPSLVLPILIYEVDLEKTY
jgi:hypothetical protein